MKEIRSLEEDMFLEYASKAIMLDKIYFQIDELERTIDELDKDIDEAEDAGLDELAEIRCKVRNAINLERLELESQMHKLGLWLAEFEKIRQLTR